MINISRDFIAAKMLEVIPTLDVSVGSRADDIVIRPLVALFDSPDITDFEDFLKTRIQEFDQDILVEPGTANYDILIAPLLTILEPLYLEIRQLKSYQTLNNYDSMPEEELDALIANYFMTRTQGAKATGSVRVYFSKPVAATFSSFTRFVTRSGLGFVPRELTFVPASTMSYNQQGDLYFVDLNVMAENSGSNYNIVSKQIISAENVPSNYVKVTNLNAFSNGSDKETNTELYLRAKDAITHRNLGTKKGIRFLLREQFPAISDMQVIGFGDREMERDLEEYGYTTTITITQLISGDQVLTVGSTTVTGANYIHVGSKADVYINTVDFAESYLDVRGLSAGYPVTLSKVGFFPVNMPLIRIKDIERLDPLYYVGTGAYIPCADPIDARVYRDFYISRDVNTLERSIGTVRIFFNRPTSFSVSEDTLFTAENGETFTPISTQSITATGMVLNSGQNITQTEMDSNIIYNYDIVYYYFDVVVKSNSVGSSEALLGSNDKLTVTGYTSEGWTIRSSDTSVAFSTEEDILLNFSSTFNDGMSITGESARIIYEYAPVVQQAQEYVDDEDNRIVTTDLLIKHFQPAYVDIAVYYENGPTTDQAELQVRNFINGIAEGEYLEVSDIISLLYQLGASRIETPIEVFVSIINYDRTFDSARFTDRYKTNRRIHFVARNVNMVRA